MSDIQAPEHNANGAAQLFLPRVSLPTSDRTIDLNKSTTPPPSQRAPSHTSRSSSEEAASKQDESDATNDAVASEMSSTAANAPLQPKTPSDRSAPSEITVPLCPKTGNSSPSAEAPSVEPKKNPAENLGSCSTGERKSTTTNHQKAASFNFGFSPNLGDSDLFNGAPTSGPLTFDTWGVDTELKNTLTAITSSRLVYVLTSPSNGLVALHVSSDDSGKDNLLTLTCKPPDMQVFTKFSTSNTNAAKILELLAVEFAPFLVPCNWCLVNRRHWYRVPAEDVRNAAQRWNDFLQSGATCDKAGEIGSSPFHFNRTKLALVSIEEKKAFATQNWTRYHAIRHERYRIWLGL